MYECAGQDAVPDKIEETDFALCNPLLDLILPKARHGALISSPLYAEGLQQA